MGRAAFLLLIPLCVACASDPPPPPPESAGGLTRTEPDEEERAGLPGYRPAKDWKDQTQGPLTTLVYMSAAGSAERPRPYALVVSSDPNNTYFHRETTSTVSVRRLYREEMAKLVRTLDGDGFARLPWADFGFREKIGAERAFYVYRDGTCRRVAKRELALEEPRKAFTRVEKRLIALTNG